MKGHATTQAKANRQCAHGHESVGETSSSFENDDSLVISFIDQKTDNMAVMFDDIEDCFLFKNDLDHKIEEYKLERDNMSKFLTVKEFTANTQIEKGYTSLCLPINQQPIVLSGQNEGSTCIFVVGSKDKVMLHDFQDPLRSLLQALEKRNFV